MSEADRRRERRDLLKWQKEILDAGHKADRELSRLQGFKNVAYLLASSLPMFIIYEIFGELAGKTTAFTGDVKLSFGLSIAMGAGWANERRRTKSERAELKRVRARLDQLESTVEEYQRSLEA